MPGHARKRGFSPMTMGREFGAGGATFMCHAAYAELLRPPQIRHDCCGGRLLTPSSARRNNHAPRTQFARMNNTTVHSADQVRPAASLQSSSLVARVTKDATTSENNVREAQQCCHIRTTKSCRGSVREPRPANRCANTGCRPVSPANWRRTARRCGCCCSAKS